MHYIKAKSILSAHNNMNIYRGCTHGCIYCDSRSTCYQINHKFEDIAVKENAIELLENQLIKKRKKCMIATGSMSDPYNHFEKKLEMTRKSLEIIYKYGFGVTLLTKSNLILRDIDLIEKINKKSKAVVQITLTTYDESLCKILEPHVSTTFERYQVLKECQKRNIPTVVWLGPILPYINDNFDNLKALLEYCIDAGVKGILSFGVGMTLREGNREYYYKKLDENFPGLKEKYIKEFGTRYEIYTNKSKDLYKFIYNTCVENNIMIESKDVFNYLSKFPNKHEQISLF